MATDVSIKVGVDGEKEFRSALNGINSQIKSLNNEMKSVVSGFTDMDDAESRVAKQTDVLGRAIDATKQKIKTIGAEYDRQKAKLDELGAALEEASNAEYSSTAERERAITKATNAYNKQATAVNKLSSDLNSANADLNRMEKEMRDLESSTDEASDALDDLGDDAQQTGTSLRDAFAGGAIAGGIQSLISGISSLVDQTTEYRKIMGTLEVSSQKAGYSADQTATSYRQLYGVIGDDQQSATALANLQALGVSQDQLTMFIDGTIGAWATYGDSIPIDSLSEAINETAQAGVVTGTFADVLNWAGTSEDEFNEKLAACSTESERANLILQELQNQGLIGAAEAWRENNEAMVASNEAQLAMNDSLASIGETLSPLVTMLTTGLAAALEAIQPAIQFIVDNAGVIIAAIAGISAGIAAMNLGSIAGLITGIGSSITGLIATIGGPITLVVAAISGIAAALIYLWNTNETFRTAILTIWENITMIFQTAWQNIQMVWSAAQPFFQAIGTAIQTVFSVVASVISAVFSAAYTAVTTIWSAAVGFFQGVWNGIQTVFSVVASVLGGFFSAAWSAIQAVWNTVVGFFQGVWSGIQNAFSSVQSFFSNAFTSAKNAVQNAWSGISGFFSGKWSEIKGVFSDVWSAFSSIGSNIVNGIKSGVAGAWDSLTGWLREKVNGLVSGVKGFLGIASPSKVFAEIGGYMAEGMAVGIEKGMPEAVDAMETVNDKIIKTSKSLSDVLTAEQERLNDELAKMTEQANEEQAEDELAQQKKTIDEKYAELEKAEVSERQKILDEIADLEADWNEKQLEAQKEAEKEKLQAQIDTLEEFKQEYENALSEIEDAQESMSDKLRDYGELFETVKTETREFLQLGDLEDDIAAIQRYGEALEQLKARGVSDSLMDEVLGMSVDDATAYTEKLLNMTDDQYTEYMALWEQKQKAAQDVAKQFYASELGALESEFISKIPSELDGVKSEFEDVGVQSVQGLIAGMLSQTGALFSAARSLISDALGQMQDEAGIHSPSRVAADMVGAPLAEGVEMGFLDKINSAARNIASVMQSRNGIISRMAAPAYAGTAGGVMTAAPIQVNVPVDLSIDGAVIARKTYTAYVREEKLRGQSAVRSSRNGG